jgi:hypothetical protein
MKSLKPVSYKTCDEILEDIKQREAEADRLPAGPLKQAALIEIGKLRIYASAKQWLGEGRATSAPAQSQKGRAR